MIIIYVNIMRIKQVIVMRKDLNMRKGKIAAQAAHASMKVFFDRMRVLSGYRYIDGIALNGDARVFNPTPEMNIWIDGTFDKICVSVNSDDELMAIYQQALDIGLPVSMIEDCGKTEFHGMVTKTCLAIGPDSSDKIDPITGHLPLL